MVSNSTSPHINLKLLLMFELNEFIHLHHSKRALLHYVSTDMVNIIIRCFENCCCTSLNVYNSKLLYVGW
jgi:hypothetical protein